jgi:hypothetical protein
MRLYALVEAGDPETIDLFLSEEEAQRALEGCLRDEPSWRDVLRRGDHARRSTVRETRTRRPEQTG